MEKNVPFTKQQVEDLPKGFHPSTLPNRSFMKKFKKGILQFVMIGKEFMLTTNHHPNCRKLTEGREDFKLKKFNRLEGPETINPLKVFGNETRGKVKREPCYA